MQGIQIKPYPNNAKEHTDEQIELIAKSIERFGWQQPIKVNKEGYIIVGHGRWEAYQRFRTLYKLEAPWVIGEGGQTLSGEATKKQLTKEEEASYRLADNEINALTGNNMRMVKEELIMIADPELQMLTGHDLDILIEEDEADNAVPSVPETPKSKLGDLYKLGNHFLLCGDSTKHEDVHKLVQLAKMDCVITDPPYNVNYKGIGENTSQGIMNDNMEESAFDDFLHDTFERMAETVKEGAGCYIFHSHKTASQFEKALKDNKFIIDTQLIWNKPSAGLGMNHYRTKHEPFFYCSLDKNKTFYGDRTGTTVWKIPNDPEKMFKWLEKQFNKQEQGESTIFSAKRENTQDYVHPTQKPVELILKILHNSTKKGDFVLDLFGGSGTTLIACEKASRQAFIMEFDPHYADVIVQRYVNFITAWNRNNPDNQLPIQVTKNGTPETWEPTI